MARNVESVVIGAGPGGYVAALRLAQLGVETVLVERDALGGECLNYGCIPSKALIHAGNLVRRAQEGEKLGITVKGVHVDAEKLQAWKQGVVDRLTRGIGQLCKAAGVEVLFGDASFAGPKELQVKTEAGSETLAFESAIVATGSEPIPLKGFEWDGERVLYAKEALELKRVPATLTVIGGGITGLEIGTMYAKLGTKVTVVELLDQLLPGTAKDLVQVVERSLRRLGVAYHVETKALGMEPTDDGLRIRIRTPGGEKTLESEVLLVSVGRRPRTKGLGLEAAGVEQTEQGFVRANERMETNVEGIYAIGDVIGVPFLAHKASKEGMIAAEVIAGQPSAADYRALPAAIFTDPEIATVGLSEEEAAERGVKVTVGRFPFAASGRALTTADPQGFVKLIAEEESGLLLGAEIVGPEASDLISELALAIEMGAVAEDIALTIHPHPTLPESIMGAAEDVYGRAIHLPKR